jgi:hypothetical protein
MPRSSDTIEAIIDAAVARVTSRIIPAIERALAQAGAGAPQGRGGARRSAAPRRRRSREEITRWVADKRARRVPLFVIDATGLDTKKKIVAKFGEDAAFEKGKPPPPTLSHPAKGHRRAGEASAARVAGARPRLAAAAGR